MSIQTADDDLGHIYPDFREVVEKVLERIAAKTGEKWRITEGYRSQERQLWLYGQGRPGFKPYGRPGNKVTWTLKSKHKSALAVDVIPTKKGYAAPHQWWVWLKEIYEDLKLENPAWSQGDFGHVQWPEKDKATYHKAAAWVSAGFPEEEPSLPPPPERVKIYVDGAEVPDAHGFLLEDRVWAALRPVATALDWIIATVDHDEATLVTDGKPEVTIDLKVLAGTGYARVRDMGPLAASFEWDETKRSVSIRSG